MAASFPVLSGLNRLMATSVLHQLLVLLEFKGQAWQRLLVQDKTPVGQLMAMALFSPKTTKSAGSKLWKRTFIEPLANWQDAGQNGLSLLLF